MIGPEGDDAEVAARRLQGALRRRSLIAPQMTVNNLRQGLSLQSEVSLELAQGLLAHVTATSSLFSGLAPDVLKLLAERLSVIRFSAGEQIMVEGETGTWFGILLSGQLLAQLANGGVVPISEGEIIGEMAIWNKGGVRANSVVAPAVGGVMAVMLCDDLRALTTEHPKAGCQLMQVR